MIVVHCPVCQMKVSPRADGTCPSCSKEIPNIKNAEIAPAAEKPAPKPSSPETAGPQLVDATPFFPVSRDSHWDKAAQKRDRIAAKIDESFRRHKTIAWVRKSKPGEYPLYVAVNSWRQTLETPLTATFDRSSLKVAISVAPYLEFPLIYDVTVKRHLGKLERRHWRLTDSDIDEFVHYLLEGGAKPRYFRWPLMRELIRSFVPFVLEKNKLVRDVRPRWTIAKIFGVLGTISLVIFVFVCANYDSFAYSVAERRQITLSFGLWIGVTAMMLAVSAFLAWRRPRLVAIPKQSARTPRREFLFDSWHVSVPGAGDHFESFRDRLYRAASANDAASVEATVELHQNATPTGFEERERLVLTRGQVTLHLHVYRFGKDAFVGWESHLNWHRWQEGTPVSTTIQEGSRIVYRSLDVGVHVPTEFDLIEANVLAETTHRVLVDEIKAFLEEQEIEADLDFQIIRGDRGNALKEGTEKNDNKSD